MQAGAGFLVSTGDAGGCFHQPFAVGVLPDREEKLADGGFSAGLVELGVTHRGVQILVYFVYSAVITYRCLLIVVVLVQGVTVVRG